MAQITINIPNAVLTRAIDGVSYANQYRDLLPDGTPNPVNKQTFAKQCLINYIKLCVSQYEGEKAVAKARQDTRSSVNTDIVLS